MFCTLRPGSQPYLGTGNSYQVTEWSNEKGFEMLRYSGVYSSKMTALCSIRSCECGVSFFTYTLAEMKIFKLPSFWRKGEKLQAESQKMQTKPLCFLIQQWEKSLFNLWGYFELSFGNHWQKGSNISSSPPPPQPLTPKCAVLFILKISQLLRCQSAGDSLHFVWQFYTLGCNLFTHWDAT